MKKKLLCLIGLSGLLFCSCKKQYTCSCQAIAGSGGTSSQFVISSTKQSDAQTTCAGYSILIPNSSPPAYSTSCALK